MAFDMGEKVTHEQPTLSIVVRGTLVRGGRPYGAGECIGEDLWNFKTKRGVGIKLAIDYQADFAGKLGNWRFKEIGSFNTKSFYSNLLRAEDAFGDGEYEKKARHYTLANNDSLSRLLYPKTLLR